MSFDVITVGGGLGGAALAKRLAEGGVKVLVVERTKEFRDRVRGEVLVSWGVAELVRAGLYDLVHGACGNDLPWWDFYVGGQKVFRRNLPDTVPQGLPFVAFYHPAMQDLVLDAAAGAGAEIRRGARVTSVEPGEPPAITIEHDGRSETLRPRLVAGCDGRGSHVRRWAGFEAQRDPERRLFAGVLLDRMTYPADSMAAGFLPGTGLMTLLFPQGGERVRCYVGFQKGHEERFQGPEGLRTFIERSVACGIPAGCYAESRPAGPLATFDGTDEWVPHPYRNGVALLGDAAATSDPTWGQGMSLTLRDVNELADRLLAGDDWDAAAHAYADEHDEVYANQHRGDGWFTDLFLDVGAEADERRMRALPLLLEDPTRILDTPLGGPLVVADEAARRRFFGEA